jgi:hypothetical protein
MRLALLLNVRWLCLPANGIRRVVDKRRAWPEGLNEIVNSIIDHFWHHLLWFARPGFSESWTRNLLKHGSLVGVLECLKISFSLQDDNRICV